MTTPWRPDSFDLDDVHELADELQREMARVEQANGSIESYLALEEARLRLLSAVGRTAALAVFGEAEPEYAIGRRARDVELPVAVRAARRLLEGVAP